MPSLGNLPRLAGVLLVEVSGFKTAGCLEIVLVVVVAVAVAAVVAVVAAVAAAAVLVVVVVVAVGCPWLLVVVGRYSAEVADFQQCNQDGA